MITGVNRTDDEENDLIYQNEIVISRYLTSATNKKGVEEFQVN